MATAGTLRGFPGGMKPFRVGPVMSGGRDAWLALRAALWPDGAETHPSEVDAFLRGSATHPEAVLVARESGRVVGFVELAVRPFAEGCTSNRVGYVEGWYVEEASRRRGIGRALLSAAEEWARQQACPELASDAAAENEVSIRAHLACGFDDAGTIRCFRKRVEAVSEPAAGGPTATPRSRRRWRTAALTLGTPAAAELGHQLRKVSLEEKLRSFSDLWSPKVVGRVNDVHVKLVKLQGEFPWHRHEDEDELFLVLEGRLRLEFRDREEMWLVPGEMAIVPRGTEHRPVAPEEVHLLLVEPVGTLNTGDVRDQRTVDHPEWI